MADFKPTGSIYTGPERGYHIEIDGDKARTLAFDYALFGDADYPSSWQPIVIDDGDECIIKEGRHNKEYLYLKNIEK